MEDTAAPRIVVEPEYRNLDEVRRLFMEYAASLDIDLAFQNFDDELGHLPGKYAPPKGGIYLAKSGGRTAGCVALRPFDETRCEMKRLFVRKDFRGQGIGFLLARKTLEEAAAMGYAAMLLDTLESMPEAVALYEKMGFSRIPAYCHNPQPDAVFMEKVLGYDMPPRASAS